MLVSLLEIIWLYKSVKTILNCIVKQRVAMCCSSVWSAGWLTLFFLMNYINNLCDFPPSLMSNRWSRGPVQHPSQLCYGADYSTFVCWKERLSKGYPHIWIYKLYKAAQLVSDPLTVKNISDDSHHFHTSDKNIQSDPYMDACLHVCLQSPPPPPPPFLFFFFK